MKKNRSNKFSHKEAKDKETYNNSKKRVESSSGTSLKKTFKNIVAHTKKHLKNIKPKCKKALMELAYATAQELTSDSSIHSPRIIPVPKSGGFLPLIPIFAGLSATGSLVGGAAGIAKAVNAYKTAKNNWQKWQGITNR